MTTLIERALEAHRNKRQTFVSQHTDELKALRQEAKNSLEAMLGVTAEFQDGDVGELAVQATVDGLLLQYCILEDEASWFVHTLHDDLVEPEWEYFRNLEELGEIIAADSRYAVPA